VRHSQPADRHCGRLLQKLAAVDAPVALFVIKIEHALVDLALGQGVRHFGYMGRRFCIPLFSHRRTSSLEPAF